MVAAEDYAAEVPAALALIGNWQQIHTRTQNRRQVCERSAEIKCGMTKKINQWRDRLSLINMLK